MTFIYLETRIFDDNSCKYSRVQVTKLDVSLSRSACHSVAFLEHATWGAFLFFFLVFCDSGADDLLAAFLERDTESMEPTSPAALFRFLFSSARALFCGVDDDQTHLGYSVSGYNQRTDEDSLKPSKRQLVKWKWNSNPNLFCLHCFLCRPFT